MKKYYILRGKELDHIVMYFISDLGDNEYRKIIEIADIIGFDILGSIYLERVSDLEKYRKSIGIFSIRSGRFTLNTWGRDLVYLTEENLSGISTSAINFVTNPDPIGSADEFINFLIEHKKLCPSGFRREYINSIIKEHIDL